MKKLFVLIALIGVLGASCSNDDVDSQPMPQKPIENPSNSTSEQPVFETDEDGGYVVGAEGGTVKVIVMSNIEYRVDIPDEAAGWLSVSDTRATRMEKLVFTITANTSTTTRTTTVRLLDVEGVVLKSLNFSQEGAAIENGDTDGDGTEDSGDNDKEDTIFVVDNNVVIEPNGGEVYLVITTNIEYVVNIPADAANWLSLANTRAVHTDNITLVIAENQGADERSAVVEITDLSGKKLYSITLVQKGATIEEDGGDKEDSDEDAPIVVIPNNEIWYTSTNGTVINPSRGDYNDYASTLTTFNAEIVTNVYQDGKGVIIFDGDVTTFGECAFYECSNLKTITLPNSVTTVANEAFYGCTNLTSVTMGDNVTVIGESAFDGCTSLTSVTIPDSVTTIGESAFDGCTSLTSVTIPDSVTTIGDYAFSGCGSLAKVYITNISAWCRISFENMYANPLYYAKNLYLNGKLLAELSIPSDVTEIKPYAFYYCSGLTSVTISDSVTSIEDQAFYKCSRLTNATIGNGMTTIGGHAFCDCSSLTSVTIPESVTTIEWYAFSGCSSLTSITIPDSVTTIGSSVFNGCSSLTSVTIGKGLASIGRDAFAGCTGELVVNCNIPSASYYSNGVFYGSKFTSVTFGDSVTTIGGFAFYYCDSLTSVTIPDSVTTIGNYAFGGCSSLTSVTISDSVTSIGDSAFYECSNLTSVYISDLSAWCRISFESTTANPLYYAKNLYLNNELVTDLVIPSDITEIKSNAFDGCSSLTSVTIPDSVTTIGDYAFYECSSLTSVTIPDSVTTIGDSAFCNCISLTSVYCKAVTPPTGSWDMFYNNASGRKIYVPTESVEAYKSAKGWSVYADDIVGYDF